MIVLLDTHALLWFLQGDPQLSMRGRQLIEDEENVVLVSVASLWEMAIKTGKGSLTLEGGFQDFVKEQIVGGSAFQLLNVRTDHVIALSRLPSPRAHKDPFDRLIVAQAIVEQASLITRDPALTEYAPLLTTAGGALVW